MSLTRYIDHTDDYIQSVDQIVGYKLYFAQPDLSDVTDIIEAQETEANIKRERLTFIKLCLSYFRSVLNGKLYAPSENNCIPLEYNALKEQVFQPEDKFEILLRDKPQFVIDCIGCALYHILYGVRIDYDHDRELGGYGGLTDNDESITKIKKKINARIFQFKYVLQFSQLNSNIVGKFISIKGTVIRVSNVRPMVRSMDFQCMTCNTIFKRFFEDGRIMLPRKCSQIDCKGKIFDPIRSSAVTVDWQRVKVQEETDITDPKGGVPKSVECELTEDLVESIVPGDIITICGIAKALREEDSQSIYSWYVDVNSIDCNKQTDKGGKGDAITFTVKDMYGIRDIAESPNLFKLIVNSICTSIVGLEMVKAGLTLALFGGNTRNLNNKHKLAIRGDPHVLIVGDPGLGKSQMLKAFQNISPRGVYVSGGYTSKAGLTVSLHREEGGGGDFALEAGALVLGDQGCCCIDEFDKMPNEHPALLEAMEQQSVSIAKAGIVCNLPARTTVIAAANPKGGHYNRSKTVSQNLKMSAPLLSRFDLIFILLDKPNQDMDSIISNHIMELHSISPSPGKANNKRKIQSQQSISQRYEASQQKNQNGRIHLLNRLMQEPGEESQHIPPILLRKYLRYAKTYVKPVMTEEAIVVIQDFYLELRKKASTQDSAPVTTRQLESLIRLSEARAKVELRDQVTKEDALDVVDIFKESLLETFEDEYGNIDFRKGGRSGIGGGQASQVKIYSSIIAANVKKRNCDLFSKDEIYAMIKDHGGANLDKFDQIFYTLNEQGYILKERGKYKFRSY